MEVAIIKRETTGTGKRSFSLITRINSEAHQVIKSYTVQADNLIKYKKRRIPKNNIF